MSADQFFTSSKNYLKRSPLSGSTSLAAPSSVGSWGTKVSSYVVTHNLGYIPLVRVYFESSTNGHVYPATGNRVTGTGLGINSAHPFCLYELTTTTLTIYLECDTFTSPTGSRNIYWIIYMDKP